jgi:H/ACA ribonucleoprotein complex subunit 4
MTNKSPSKLPFETTKRKVLVKKKATPSPDLGGDPNKRSVEQLIKYGIVNIDKPKGPTSHQVSSYVQKILGVSKAGHSGTLDPRVTGVLPIALSGATKTTQTLLKAGKEYVCIMHLHKKVDEKAIHAAIKSFVGEITQLPPIKSAVKREKRQRTIYYIDILEIEEQDVLFIVGCQAGTYIRKLCHDLGEKIGCGAHMEELRRTKAGPFQENTLVKLHDLQDAWWYYKNKKDETHIRKLVQPMENAITHIPKVWVLDSAVSTMCHGADLKAPGLAKVETDIIQKDLVAVMTLKEELVALGVAQGTSIDLLNKEKGVIVKIEKVFMKPSLYKKH